MYVVQHWIAEDFKNQEGKVSQVKNPKFQSSRAFIEWHYFQLHGKEFSIPLSKKLLGIFGSNMLIFKSRNIYGLFVSTDFPIVNDIQGYFDLRGSKIF